MLAAVAGVDEPAAMAALDVEHELEAVGEQVIGKAGVHLVRGHVYALTLWHDASLGDRGISSL